MNRNEAPGRHAWKRLSIFSSKQAPKAPKDKAFFKLASPTVLFGESDNVTLLLGCGRPWHLRRRNLHFTLIGEENETIPF